MNAVDVWTFLLHWLLPRLAVGFVSGGICYYLLYKYVIPPIVWGQYRKEMKLHELHPPNSDHGAGSSDLLYLGMTYDVTDKDIVIEGEVPPAPYWQMGVYDNYVRALQGGHHNNRSVTIRDGRWSVRITRNPRGRPDRLDASTSPKGIFVYRVALPTGEVVTPTLRFEAPE